MSGGEFQIGEAFAPREARWLGDFESGGWRLKRYGVVGPGRSLETGALGDWESCCEALLPDAGAGSGRPGVGFVIVHAGGGWEYLVVCWWDSGNELCVRVLSRPRGESEWRKAREGQSFCVWDMELMWHERNAYIEHVLRDARGDLDGYVADRYGGERVG
ncbi:MAG: isochorismatase [Planctomycetota bacterium]|jgi:hypothetical protein